MEVIKKYKKQFIFHLVLNVIIGVFISFSSYYHLPLFYFKDYLIYGIHFLILQFTLFGFAYFLSLNKVVFYFTFPILFFFSAVSAFWIYTQDVSISESLIQAVFESKIDIALDLISSQVLVHFVLVIMVIGFLILYRSKINITEIKSPLSFVALVSILVFAYMYKNSIGNLHYRMPYNLGFGIFEYYKKNETELLPINYNLKANRTDVNIVFVLGESVRSKNLGLNGYNRNTTPLLEKRKNLISFPNVYTPLTYTAVSVPQIVTNKSINDSINNTFVSLYSVLNKLDYKTSWIGNQSPEKSYIPFIEENDSINLIDFQHGVFSFNKKLDEELLFPFKNEFKEGNKKFFTLHMIGSHWWYENRYTNAYRKFTPTINSKHVPSQSSEQMINSYDNTILYLDNFLNNVIEICDNSNEKIILIYLSDHGEILGEEGKWLHAQNSEASTNPAMLLWYSNEFNKSYPELVNNVKDKSMENISTDFFYHSIIDLLNVSDIELIKTQSIFYPKKEVN